jgi:hypothetical protein
MSYDKYIKYKSKYLQLKAKYTQVGGAGMWTISYEEGGKITTPITLEESNTLNEAISKNKGKEVIINYGDLRDKNGKKLKNDKGDMNYKYIINADGISGTRISTNGEYKMIFVPDDTQGASHSRVFAYASHPFTTTLPSPRHAPPPFAFSASAHRGDPAQPSRSASGASGASLLRASAYAPSHLPPRHPPPSTSTSTSASSASVYAPPPPPRSASSVPFLYEIPDLPDYFTIYDKYDSKGNKYKIVCVKKFELMQHLTNIGNSITIDGIVYTKNTGSTIEMKTKNNYIYQLNNMGESDTFCIYYK